MIFFESFFGHYLSEAVFYSLIAVAAVEGMMAIWRIREPLTQVEFRLLVLLLPVLCPPLFYLLYPSRLSTPFRQMALLDLNRWLGLELAGGIGVWHLFAAMLAITTGFFAIKGVLPVIRHYSGQRPSLPVIEKGQFPNLDEALADLSKTGDIPVPTVLLSPEDTMVAYSSGRRTLVISAAIIDLLDKDELQAVIAHEVAHLSEQAVWIGRVLLLRFLMFYNPLAIPVFHRIINDSEKLYDDIAMRFSGERLPLVSALLKISRRSATTPSADTGKRRPWQKIAALENDACQSLVMERAKRIIHQDEEEGISYQKFGLAVTAVMLSVLLFFVV